MEYLYKIKQLYIQCEFKDYSEKQIRNLYKINPSHKILSGIWTGPIFRKGFVITDNGLYINLGFNSKLLNIFIEKKDTDILFSIDKVIANDIKNSSDSFVSKLSIKRENQINSIYFKTINDETKQTLLDLLHFGLNQGEIPKIDLQPIVIQKKSSKFQNFIDFLSTSIIDIKKNISLRFSKLKLKHKQKETKKIIQNKSFSFSLFFSHFFDFLSSLAFMAAVIISLKPELLPGLLFDRNPTKITEFIGNLCLQIKLLDPPAKELLPIRNLWVTIFLSLFILFKTLVMFLCHSSKKFVSFLMPILTILTCFFVSEKFLLFVLFCIILYFCFELLCDFPPKTIIRKLIFLIISSIILYFLAHIILMKSQMFEIFSEIDKALKNLFQQLSLPIFFW